MDTMDLGKWKMVLTMVCLSLIILEAVGNAREKRSAPQIEVACTIYTLAKSCTDLLKDCDLLCTGVDTTCSKLSKMSQLAGIACDDKDSMTQSMDFFKNAEVAKANGITDTETFWAEVEKDPLKVVKEILTKMIANGGLQMSPDQFLGNFDTGIGGASTSLTNNALGNAVNNEALGTAGKVLDGSLTGGDLVNSGKAVGEGVEQGAKDLVNDAKDTLDELTDVNLNNIDDKVEDLTNKALDTANSLVDKTKAAFDDLTNLWKLSDLQNIFYLQIHTRRVALCILCYFCYDCYYPG